ncbi:uncharacterized protein AB675_5771 [Cyphellophora attinorum]|uniref:Uncharacterized protein n=1 Tax=Cyphellophora attinorum TaxID=1664694 RepID=A0A0N0NLB5_9EURO|nr:uncharacterized protein AB675_5771 [Phialophora attinorum]KPI38849.1 hypothetical protein AB675_5771 [Phialophora attinorum]
MSTAAVPAIDSITTLPQPSHITLLLKHAKSTVFLSVSPQQPFTSIKSLLLSALQARNITLLSSSDGTSTSLPSSPDGIELGVLVDKKDASRGWTLLDSSTAATPKSTTKSKAKAATSKDDPDTPAGAGLADGSWLAYRVKKEGSSDDVSVDENGDVVVDMEGDQGWYVVLPSFEEDEAMDGDGDDAEMDGVEVEVPAVANEKVTKKTKD